MMATGAARPAAWGWRRRMRCCSRSKSGWPAGPSATTSPSTTTWRPPTASARPASPGNQPAMSSPRRLRSGSCPAPT
jgi:hypothetical protein